MAKRRREFSTFSLSFIDCMCCGLGAVILLFMLINHASRVQAISQSPEPRVAALEAKVLAKRDAIKALETSVAQAQAATQAAREQAGRLSASIARGAGSEEGYTDERARIATLKQRLRNLESRVQTLRDQASRNATRIHAGEGQRLYLTGLQVSGDHILILLDSSASMLAETIVNIVLRRNMSAAARRSADKWQRALATVDWITTQVPPASKFQLYTFGDTTHAVLDGTTGRWLTTRGGARLSAALRALQQAAPSGGTDLRAAFAAAARLSPPPDSIYLITDSLPTQAGEPESGAVSQAERLDYYAAALDTRPPGTAINVILLPMEGDPLAASAFWQLALATGGAFLSPSEDWP